MLKHLFVYGTLRRSSSLTNRSLLGDQARFLELGYVHGLLHDVGAYPGLVLTSSYSQKVVGEIYHVANIQQILVSLDEYEECSELFPKPHEYNRRQCEVYGLNGTVTNCWAYVYNWPIVQLKMIQSGDYLANIKRHNSS